MKRLIHTGYFRSKLRGTYPVEIRKGAYTIKTPNQMTRIQKAIELIESGAVTPMTEGRYSVRTERMNIQYTVTMTSCDCYDFTETLKGESPCKRSHAHI